MTRDAKFALGGVTTYEAGDFTYLITPYEVDHG